MQDYNYQRPPNPRPPTPSLGHAHLDFKSKHRYESFWSAKQMIYSYSDIHSAPNDTFYVLHQSQIRCIYAY